VVGTNVGATDVRLGVATPGIGVVATPGVATETPDPYPGATFGTAALKPSQLCPNADGTPDNKHTTNKNADLISITPYEC
jgi:hypothetical protein